MQNTKDATQNMQRTKDATKIYTTKDATHKMHTTLRCISSFAGRYLYFTCMRPMFGVLCGSVWFCVVPFTNPLCVKWNFKTSDVLC